MRSGSRFIGVNCAVSCLLAFLALGPRDAHSRTNTAIHAPAKGRQPSRVILITVDTLRSDRLECYGYERIKTPNFNRLAADGVRFTNAVAQVPLTLPSHTSIMTGTYPVFHGVHDQTGYLSGEHATLAGLLKEQGFTTAAFVSTFVLNSRSGLNHGFENYDDAFDRGGDSSPDEVERRGDQTLSRALVWMEKFRGGNFFLWLHFYDPHAPYAPPEPYRTRYLDRPYDGEVAFVDSLLGELTRFLVAKGWYSQTLLVLAADHGEDLGDHREYTHGFFVYDSTLRIPLIVKMPGSRFAGRVIGAEVQSVDIAPTVLQILSLSPASEMQGKSLLSLMTQQSGHSSSPALGETYYPLDHFGWSPLRFLRTERYKYIEAPKPELYDLRRDPRETQNLFGKRRSTAEELRKQLFDALGRFARRNTSPAATQRVDIATLEKLKSLGYVGYAARRTASETADYRQLADPKEKLGVYNRLESALLDERNNRLAQAIRKYRELTGAEPNMIDAYIHLGLCYKRLGQYEDAVGQFKEALRRDSENAVASYNLAHSYALAGKVEEAVIGFQRTLQLDPQESRAHVGLGIAYQLKGELNQAVEEYRQALEINPSDTTALSNLGAALLSMGRADEALVVLRRAAEIDPKNAKGRNLLGSALLVKGDLARAIENFRRALDLKPRYAEAFLNLGLALLKKGDSEEGIAALKKALEINPSWGYAHQLLGEAYAAQGMRQAAEAEFQAARNLGSH